MKSLRALRTDAGLTQADLAYKAGLSSALISQIELGAGNSTLDTMERLAAALGSDLVTIAAAVKASAAEAV